MAELWDVLDERGNKTGRLYERIETPIMGKGEYHLAVYIWIENDRGEFLISQRTPNKTFPNMWECTGGNAVAGDDSLTTALKEVREELGITLDPKNGKLIKQCKLLHPAGDGLFADIWHFRQNVDISTVTLCPDETCDAMWASRDKINSMIDEGTFQTWKMFTRIEELFGGTSSLASNVTLSASEGSKNEILRLRSE